MITLPFKFYTASQLCGIWDIKKGRTLLIITEAASQTGTANKVRKRSSFSRERKHSDCKITLKNLITSIYMKTLKN